MYPTNIKLSILESRHPEYINQIKALRDIDHLVSGGYKLANVISEFLPQRPGEDAELYETRLSKFTYANILSASINELVSKISNAPISISGIDDNFWKTFRANTNLAGRTDKQLISNIFTELLKFQKVYIHVDKKKPNVEIVNKAQEEQLGLRPYVVTYSSSQVINWSENEGKIQWIKIRQLVDDTSNPFIPVRKKAIWTFIDNTYVARYAAYVELDRYGNLEKVNGEYINNDTEVALSSDVVVHGLSVTPVIKIEVPSELWVANQAVHKALEHLRIDCTKYDLLSMSYFQRTYKSLNHADSELQNLGESFVDEDDRSIPTGLAHVIEVDEFKWNEPQGTIITPMMDALKQIENQVSDIISLGGVSAESGVVTQSGESKKMDFYKSEMKLRAYGEILCESYQDVLQLVAAAAGLDTVISVTGLNNFEKDNLDIMISRLNELSKVDLVKLKSDMPPTAFKLVLRQLVNQLVGNASPEQQKLIEGEIEAHLNNLSQAV